VRGVFTNQRFLYDQPVADTGKVPEQLVAPGLIRFTRDKNCNLLIIADPRVNLYSQDGTQSITTTSRQNMIRQYPQVHNLQAIEISKIHHGAHLNGDIVFINRHLSIAKAVSSPGNEIKWVVDSEKPIDLRENSHIVLNAYSAPHVLCLDTQPPANEVHQYKYMSRSAGIGQHDYLLERNKAARFSYSRLMKDDLILPCQEIPELSVPKIGANILDPLLAEHLSIVPMVCRISMRLA